MWAAEAGQTAAAKHLVRRGATVDLQTRLGHSALHWAAYHGRVETSRALLSMGADRCGAFDSLPMSL